MEADSVSHDLVDRLLLGSRRAAGRIISMIEDDDPRVETIMRDLYPHTGRSYVVGITGPPGAGKSVLVDALVRVIRREGRSVGVIAVDPNSPFSGGAILGDRIRMMHHALDDGVFIRSMGARGHLGGMSLAADHTISVLDAFGMDVVICETVGVGQSELEVAETADTTVVVIPPGLGDGVQAIKAGIMEIADIFVVNKSDYPGATKTVTDIRELLRMGQRHAGWSPPIVKTIATEGQGLEDLWLRIQQHRRFLEESGELEARRHRRLEREIMDIAERRLRRHVLEPSAETEEFQAMLDLVAARRMTPYEVAERLVPLGRTADEQEGMPGVASR